MSTIATWRVGEGVLDAGNWTCPAGTHLVLTIGEVNSLPKSGIPDAAVMRENFFMAFGLVLGCYVVAKMVGAFLHIVRRG